MSSGKWALRVLRLPRRVWRRRAALVCETRMCARSYRLLLAGVADGVFHTVNRPWVLQARDVAEFVALPELGEQSAKNFAGSCLRQLWHTNNNLGFRDRANISRDLRAKLIRVC